MPFKLLDGKIMLDVCNQAVMGNNIGNTDLRSSSGSSHLCHHAVLKLKRAFSQTHHYEIKNAPKSFCPLHDTSYFPDITASIRARRQTFRLRRCLLFTASLRKLSPRASVGMTFQWIKADLETIGCLGSGLNNQSVPRLLLRSNTSRKHRQNQQNQTKVWGSLTWWKSLGSSPDTVSVLFLNIINVSSRSFNIQLII